MSESLYTLVLVGIFLLVTGCGTGLVEDVIPTPTSSACGDTWCDPDEDCTSCPADCACSCGDATCDPGEDCASCPADCACAPSCGDETCNPGEDCISCPTDCACPSSCGDGTCDGGEDCTSCPADCTCSPTCEISAADLSTTDGWTNDPMTEAAYGLLTLEVYTRVATDNIDALVAIADQTVSDWSQAAITVRFNSEGTFDVRDGAAYAADASIPYVADTWYQVVVTADIAARTYTVRVGECGASLQTLVNGAGFREDAATAGGLSHVALWSSQSAAIDMADVTWTPGACEPQTCESLSHVCGTPDDGCGNTLPSCGTCPDAGVCSDGQCCTPTTCTTEGWECGAIDDGCGGTLECGSCASGLVCSSDGACIESTGPQLCDKPTDASTGPRIPVTDVPGGELSGTYSGVRFTSQVKANGPLTLTDCVLAGGLRITNGPVVLDHCELHGWFGVVTDNLDPDLDLLIMSHTKTVGPRDNDGIRIGSSVSWGHDAEYMNTYIEHSILHSPYDSTNEGNHFDLLQFGGGRNSEFSCVVFSYQAPIRGTGPTAYVNNGTSNHNVVLEDVWFEGREVSYVLYGPMTVNRCTMERSCALYGFVYPTGTRATLTDCFDDLGNPIE